MNSAPKRFPILRSILHLGISLTTLKLAVTAASMTRAWLRPSCLWVLKRFERNGRIWLRFRYPRGTHRVAMRLPDLESDFCSVRELMVEQIYRVPPGFVPTLALDGGGNIGLFTLWALGAYPGVRVLICEPVPRNIAQIREHLAVNGVDAQVFAGCLGGAPRKIPFFCREANQGSFDGQQPYDSVVEVPVVTLDGLIAGSGDNSLLIKLDIEGMEIEALESFVRTQEQRQICVVGELHDHKANKTRLQEIFERSGWTISFFDETDPGSIFQACSPQLQRIGRVT